MKNPVRPLLLFLLASFISLSIDGQEEEKPPAEEILFTEVSVVTAAKKPQKRSEAPAAVTVITAEEIKNSGARTIAEAVQYKAGLNVFSQSGINIRGVGSGSRILLLVDGARANDVFTGGFEDGFERALTQVERIEVIKGPASSLYGTNAFAGIINIITKKPQDNTGWTFKAAGGNFTTQNYEVIAGLDREKVDGLFTLSAYSDEGSDLLGENDSLSAYDSFGKLEWRDFIFSAGYRHNRQEIPSIGFTLTPELFIKRDDGYGHLHYDRTLSDKWSVSSQFVVQHEVVLLFDPEGNLDVHDLRLEGEARTNYRVSEKDNLTFGLELRRDRTNNEKTTGTEQYTSNNRSFYIENEFRWKPSFILTTGVRVDDNSVFGSTTNPRVGVVSSLPNGTVVKGFIGRAFRGPEFLLLFTDTQIGNFLIEKNPLLQPETVRSYEIEVLHPFTNWLEGRVNVYHNSLRDLISAALVGTTLRLINIGEATANGIETRLAASLGNQIDFFVNHSAQFVRDEVQDTRLPLIPRNTANCGFTVYLPDNSASISLFGKYVGSRPTTDTRTGQPTTLSDFFKADLTFSAWIRKDLEFSATVYNLFDADYDRSFGTPQEGIAILAGVRYRRR